MELVEDFMEEMEEQNKIGPPSVDISSFSLNY